MHTTINDSYIMLFNCHFVISTNPELAITFEAVIMGRLIPFVIKGAPKTEL